MKFKVWFFGIVINLSLRLVHVMLPSNLKADIWHKVEESPLKVQSSI